MKLSVITVVYNGATTISGAIESVLAQTYQNIEYIIIDGKSSDGTVEIIEQYLDKVSVFVSEPDLGVYDALNKGILHASGDVVAILHSDDRFCSSHVCSNIMRYMKKTGSEICFSDAVILHSDLRREYRYYRAKYFKRWMLRLGWMPPHPSIFIKKNLFDEFGLYSNDYQIAGDFDFLVRIFYGREIQWSYFDQISVKMLQGGLSNSGFRGKKLIFHEINHVLKSNNVRSFSVFQLMRYIIRLTEMRSFRKNSCG